MKKADVGFTLVELLVAMVVFAIASLAVSKLMVGATQAATENAESTHAIGLAQQKLEDLRNLRYIDLAAGSESRPGSEWKGRPFTVAWTVNQNQPIAGTSTVVVTVSWSRQGQTRTYATRSIYSQITAE